MPWCSAATDVQFLQHQQSFLLLLILQQILPVVSEAEQYGMPFCLLATFYRCIFCFVTFSKRLQLPLKHYEQCQILAKAKQVTTYGLIIWRDLRKFFGCFVMERQACEQLAWSHFIKLEQAVRRGKAKYGDFGPLQDYSSETVQDRR